MKNIILKATKVNKSVDTQSGRITILNELNLTVETSESIAIVGQSGSGKSTLLSVLAGLDTPNTGTVEIDNRQINNLSEDERARIRANRTGFVFQSFYLLDDLTALENIALPLELFGHRNPNSKALDWLEKLGLGHRAKHFPKQLSGGEQQRVALGRAFALKPQLLFADEPTANLDVKTANQIIEVLFELHQKSHNSMILVTHDQKLAQRCDSVYFLENGALHHA